MNGSIFCRNSRKAILNPHQYGRETEFLQKFLVKLFSKSFGTWYSLLAFASFWQGGDILCMVYAAAEGVVEVYYTLNLLEAIGYL